MSTRQHRTADDEWVLGLAIRRFKTVSVRVVPIWEWQLPEKDKKRESRFYRSALTYSKQLQIVLGVLASLFIYSFIDEFRQVVVSAANNNKLSAPIFVTDIAMFVALAFTLGWKRLPVNFVALAIVKIYITLDASLRSTAQPSITFNEKPGFLGLWSVFTVTSSGAPPSNPSYLRHSILVAMTLGAFWTIQQYIKLDWRDYKTTALISQVAVSTSAAILLISNLAVETDFELREYHWKTCEIWILFALPTCLFTIWFMFEKLRFILRSDSFTVGSMLNKGEWEGFILVLIVALTIRYIPVIHKGFSYTKLMSEKSSIMARASVPSSLVEVWNIFTTWFYQVEEQTVNMNKEYL